MDLFIMKRYGAEKEHKEPAIQEELLSSLLTKIEKRKKERRKIFEHKDEKEESLLEDEKYITESTDDKETGKQRYTKKRKYEAADEEREASSETIKEVPGDVDEPPQKKKRRKKKLEELCEILHLNETENERKDSAEIVEASHSGFTVIEEKKFSDKLKVKSVLPYWLAKPFVASGSMTKLGKTVHDIPDLDMDLVKQLEENNISHFFPVQSKVIPWLLKANKRPMQYRPNDVCVSAPTGSGKTLAFVLPIVQALKSRVVQHIRALVVLPVRDLAVQIYNVFEKYCKDTDLKVILLTGGNSFDLEQQELVKTSTIIGQYNAVDIVVTTPGRLVDHIGGTPGFSLQYLRFLVIDEADRVMENRANEWLYYVEKHICGEISGKQTSLSRSSLQTIPPPPQKLLFSATLTQDPEKLQELGLFQPKLFTVLVGENNNDMQDSVDQVRGDFVGRFSTPAELTEKYCVISSEFKPIALYHMICNENWKNVLCFTNSQENTHRLAQLLMHMGGRSLRVGEISGNQKLCDRDRALSKFSSGITKVLVSTDALTRGIDVPDVDCVVSYDLPKFVKTYIHRIGRTARAGRKGTAVTFLVYEEVKEFTNMLRIAGKEDSIEEFTISEYDLKYLEEKYINALRGLQKIVKVKRLKAKQKAKSIKTYNPRHFKTIEGNQTTKQKNFHSNKIQAAVKVAKIKNKLKT